MKRSECGVLLSASDLMRFAGCAHATTLDLAWMRGRGAAPAGDSENAELLQRHGDAHEARHLARLRAAGRSVVEIAKEGASLAQAAPASRAALQRGAEVVFQGAFSGGAWGGWSDLLERVERGRRCTAGPVPRFSCLFLNLRLSNVSCEEFCNCLTPNTPR